MIHRRDLFRRVLMALVALYGHSGKKADAMAIVSVVGWDEWTMYASGPLDEHNACPWYSRTDFMCTRCSTVFRLEESDFLFPASDMHVYYPTVPSTPSFYGRGLIWVRFDSSWVEITGPTASLYDPDRIAGWCPHCGVNLRFDGPHLGTTKDDPNTLPVMGNSGALQNAMLIPGAMRLVYGKFQKVEAETKTVMFYLRADKTPIFVTAEGMIQGMERRPELGANAFNFNYVHNVHAPARTMLIPEVQAEDPDWLAMLARFGLTVIDD